MDDVAAALDSGSPLPLLGLASSMLAMFEPRPSFGRPAEPSPPDREELIDSFFAVDLRETSALLAALAGLSGDDPLRQRVRREVSTRGHVLPRWLLGLDQAQPVEPVVRIRDVLGDAEDIVFAVRLPGGFELSVVTLVDHNMGTLVKDSFTVPGALDDLVPTLRDTIEDPDVTLTDLDPADARAMLTEAIDLGAITFPPIETESWPASRPFVRWALGLFPSGGTGWSRPDWPDDARAALVKRFLASPFGAGLDDADHRGLLDDLLWFGTGYGPGDPLRWSPASVEILLADWIPRKIVADVDYLAKAPDLLRAFIRFAHTERGIRAELTTETLGAVDFWEPEYQQTIRSPRPQGPQALLAAIGALDPDDVLARQHGATAGLDGMALESLHRAVGGPEALARLDTEALPDEPFDRQQVPGDVREPVAEVLVLVDRCCEELFDVELRTAARRLLARLAVAEPGIFAGRHRADMLAAAVCWIAGHANRAFDRGTPTVKDLMACVGVRASSPSQRAKPLLRALGIDPDLWAYRESPLGSPEYLTAGRRAEIIAARDRPG
ncbi:DUF6398 domain-containing protein [Blastococcus mobilis]|uniref:DUF6398 domain-containing protein n=1 Tax=Blastococcus mobilis TaxID=1938746 RepID=A0A238V9R2_9ACTN|nr:DUF6398 domain-containing protein [Blastococcus mobilis]SNR31140.1 hypothetical protein SAMN06272737_102277 [Blastococcus mobilis]